MTSIDLTKRIVKVLDDKKADDIQVIKVNDLTIIADYFVIASATNSTHVKSLADEIEYQLKEQGIAPRKIEGYQYANWIVMDYSDVIVHVFYEETRKFYTLERLWSDGEVIDVSTLLEE
jgi:ribosome-associated protein